MEKSFIFFSLSSFDKLAYEEFHYCRQYYEKSWHNFLLSLGEINNNNNNGEGINNNNNNINGTDGSARRKFQG